MGNTSGVELVLVGVYGFCPFSYCLDSAMFHAIFANCDMRTNVH